MVNDVPAFDARSRGVKAGPFQDDPWPGRGTYRMYHGTTMHNAERIVDEGFRAPDFDTIFSSVANEAKVSEAQLRASLGKGSFAHGRTLSLERRVFFTDSPLWAADWATWGGEALLEAWCAVYRIDHPDVSPTSNEPHEWAVKKLNVTPAVMAFDIPHESLETADNNGPLPTEGWGPEWHVIRTVSLPVPASAATLVSCHRVERGWTWDVIQARFGLHRASVDGLINSSKLPEPDDRFLGDIRWWDSTIRPYFDGLTE